jgi:hypothetical protein
MSIYEFNDLSGKWTNNDVDSQTFALRRQRKLTRVRRSEIEMIDTPSCHRDARQTDAENNQANSKRCTAVDVASRNETDSRTNKP